MRPPKKGLERVSLKATRVEARFDPAEFQMLADLASAARASTSEVLRSLTRDAYRRRFKMKNPGAEILPTPRAILEVVCHVSRPEHLTVKNIATLADVPWRAIEALFRKLERPRFFERVANDGDGQQTWESCVPLDVLLREAEKKGIDPDVPIERNSLSLDVYVRDAAKGVVGVGPLDPSTERVMPMIVEDVRGACRKIGSDMRDTETTTAEIAKVLQSLLSEATGHAVDAYANRDKVRLMSFYVEDK